MMTAIASCPSSSVLAQFVRQSLTVPADITSSTAKFDAHLEPDRLREFDSDGRRFVLGIPNTPEVTDPRGLSEREAQVVAYAVFGLTNKLVGYHLGISKGRVSTLLGSAMRKLGVHTRAGLIKKLNGFSPIV